MAWMNCGLDKGVNVVRRSYTNKHRASLRSHTREFIIISVEVVAWINCGLDHCGLDQGVKFVKG